VQQGLEAGWRRTRPRSSSRTRCTTLGNPYQTGSVVSENSLNGDATRVFIAGLISGFLAPGCDEVPLNNLEVLPQTIPPSGEQRPVRVRFLGFVSGTGDEA
jgi:hypothetical protein